jgi:hypothetical protein
VDLGGLVVSRGGDWGCGDDGGLLVMIVDGRFKGVMLRFILNMDD